MQNEQRYSHTLKTAELSVPLSVFFTDASILRVLVAYLHDVGRLSFDEIALHLKRSYAAVWTSYRKLPQGATGIPASSAVNVPLSVFSDRLLGPLEAICVFLKGAGFSYAEMGSLLRKDQRTVWTSYHRAQKKLEGREHV